MKPLVQETASVFFKQMFTIAGKDFKHLLFSPLFFVFTGISFALLSVTFPRALFIFASSYAMPMFGQAAQSRNIHIDVFISHISYLHLILLFAIPVLTMKLLAEEKRNHTFDLLMTSPLSSLQIILGKYLSLLMLLTLFLCLTLVYPLSTVFFAEIPMGPLFGSYLGLFFLVCVYSAIGLFASSLSHSLFLSATIGIVLNVGLWFISVQGQTFANPFVSALMDYLSISGHLDYFMKGSLVTNSFVFFLIVIVFFLFLALKTVELAKWRS